MTKSNSTPAPEQQALLRQLPGVDTLLTHLQARADLADAPLGVLTTAARETVTELRTLILKQPTSALPGALDLETIADRAARRVRQEQTPNLDRVINATGVVVHTNLGRSVLCPAAIDQMVRVAGGYSNLEFDLDRGQRGVRYASVEKLLCQLSGAEAALVVNNNAGAVLLALESLALGRAVIVSRGELVEIGGAFRIPDVMSKSGGRLIEVGTTNRTHPADYEAALTDDTALLLKVHTSNYSIMGFTAAVSLKEMVALGRRHQVPVMYDLGSGTFLDFRDFGLPHEPTVADTIADGADVVTFSGDKLLGGPQAGIILGKKALIDRFKKNPLTRALRIDKLTLSALELTLRAYRDKEAAVTALPTLRLLTLPLTTVAAKARQLYQELSGLADQRLVVETRQTFSRPGGGALPLLEIPTWAVTLQMAGLSASHIERALRRAAVPIIGRIDKETFFMDMRTVADSEISVITDTVQKILDGSKE